MLLTHINTYTQQKALNCELRSSCDSDKHSNYDKLIRSVDDRISEQTSPLASVGLTAAAVVAAAGVGIAVVVADDAAG